MKPHCKPLAAILKPSFLALHLAFSILNSTFAAVPLSWQVTPKSPAPVAFDRHHGETLEFRCAFSGFGELPFDQAADIRLWYQTNGMAAAWWSVPASVSSNVLMATFPPQADPGADRLALYFGAPSNAYASAVLRLRHSPGFTPNVLPPPEQATFEETDPVFAAWLATNDMIRVESDPTVPAWAKAETPPQTMTTNDVRDIVTGLERHDFGAWRITHVGGWGDPADFNLYSASLHVDGLFVVISYDDYWWSGTLPVYIGEAHLPMSQWSKVEGELPEEFGRDYKGFTLERPYSTRNALGLARLIDLPPLTNGLARLSDLPPLTNSIPDTAARAVYDVHDLMWDATESILYWHKIRQGHDEYIAVTNIDLTHPTNAVILKAWREANR